MAELQWDLARVPNIFASATQAQQQGQRRRDEQAARNALALYGQDPGAGINALRQVDPETAIRLEREREERRIQALTEAQDRQRRAAIDQAAKGDFAGATTAAGGDPDAIAAISRMDENERAKAKRRADVLAGIFSRAEGMKPDEAEAYKRQVGPALVASGMFTQQQIDGFAMTPENIQAQKAQALGIQGLLDQANRDREFASRDADRKADNETARARVSVAQQNASTNAFRAHKGPAGGGTPKLPSGFILD